MGKGRGSLARTLLLTAGSVLLATIVALLAIAYREAGRAALNGAADQVRGASLEVTGALVSLGQTWAAPAGALAAEPTVRDLLGTRAEAAREPAAGTLAAVAQGEEVIAAVVLDAGGSVLAVAPGGAPVPPLGPLDRPTADEPQIGRLTVIGGRIAFPASASLLGPGGERGTVVVWQRLLLDLRLSGAEVFVGNLEGDPWTDLKSVVSLPAAAVGQGATRYQREGQAMLAASEPVPGIPWRVVTEVPVSQVLAAPRLLLARMAIIATLLFATGLGAIALLARRIVEPLRHLTEAAEAMTAGHYSTRVERGPGGEIGRLRSAFNTMAERTQQALQEVEGQAQQYKMLFKKNPNPMWVFERSSLRFLAVNEAAVRHYGHSREEFLAMTIEDIRPAAELPRLRHDLSEGHQGLDAAGTWTHHKKDGSEITVEITSNDVTLDGRPAVLVLARDVTEVQRLERQYRHSQKMEAVGRLAGGIAHDFNNLLTVILGETELAVERLRPDDPALPALHEIGQAADRASSLTRQLLTFSRQQVVAPTVFPVNDLVTSVEKMLRRLIGEDVHLETRLHPKAGNVCADRGQMEQVLVNLAVNSRDAMPDGGVLVIETARVDRDEAQEPGAAAPADQVLISVADSGLGMTEEVRNQAFEPFFTTKPAGRSTGLGLATCYGIVRQAGGRIDLYSEPGIGTTVSVYLPSTDEAPKEPPTTRVSAPSRGGENVLVVEDQDAVRDVTARMLRALGYSVTSARDAEEALALIGDADAPIDLLLSDVVLPGMNGGELATRAREIHTGLRVLFVSGYTGDIPAYHRLVEQGVALLQKPFTSEILGRRVREILDG